MISENKLVQKLEEFASMFGDAVHRKSYGEAHNLYNMAHTTAVMVELDEPTMKRLFGDWDSDDGTETDTAEDGGLFRRSTVDEVNWQCCVRIHQSYEDIACRKRHGKLEFYSDQDYCARCKKRPPR